MALEILATEVTCPHCGVKQDVQVNDFGIHVAYCDDREADGCGKPFAFKVTEVSVTHQVYTLQESIGEKTELGTYTWRR